MNILYIEDNPAHIELARRALEHSEPEFNLQTASNIREAFSILEQTEFDVILSDHRLPDGTGLDVINKARQRGIIAGIILITNQEDINTAIAALKAGAVDYIVKQSEYLQKLPSALKNAYAHTQLEKQKIALQESEERYRSLVELSPEAIVVHSEGLIVFANSASAKLVGAEKPEDIIGKPVLSFVHPDSRELVTRRVKAMLARGENAPLEQEKFIRLDGQTIDVEVAARPIVFRGRNSIQAFVRDISEMKKSHEVMERQLKELMVLHAVAIAGTESASEDEIIERTTQIAASLYADVCGVLLLNQKGDTLFPHKSYVGANVEDWMAGYPITQGITGRAVLDGRAIRIGDVTKEPNYIEIASGVRSELCVPIRVHSRIIGVLNVESRQADAFDEKDERLLNTIAGGLGAALERFRLFKSEQEQMQREAALFKLMRTAASSLDLNLVLQSILDQLIKIIPADCGTIQLLKKDRLEIVAVIGAEAKHFAEQGPIELEKTPLNKYVITEQKPVCLDDIRLDERFIPAFKDTKIRSFLALPLTSKGRPIGMITLDSYQAARFTEQDVELGLTIANHASIAIENARLFEAEQRRRIEAEILREATFALTRSIEADKLFEVILETLEKLVPYDSASIEILNQGQLEIIAGRRINPALIGTKYPANPQKWGGIEKLRQPIIIDNVQTDERFEKFPGSEYIRSWMGIPLFSQDKLIGYLNLDSRTPAYFTEEHAARIQTFANQAATAIENARLLQEERRRSRIIEAMADIANEIATAREMTSALDKIAQRALELLQASTVAIYLLQDDNQTIKVITAQGAYREELMSHSIQIGAGITGSVIANGKPEIVDDISKDPRRLRVPGTPEEDTQFDTMMSAPLILRGKTIGAINAWRQRASGLFNTAELNFLVSIAHQTSISIESVRLFEETVRRAREADAIAEVGRDISSTLQLDVVLERIARYARDLLKAMTSAVYLLDAAESTLRAISAIGKESEEIKNHPLDVGQGILGNIALQKQGEIVNYTVNDVRAVTIAGTDVDPFEHLMGAPVISKGKLTGLLAVWRSGKGAEFKPFELEFLSSLAHQASAAIENARLYAETRRRLDEQQVISRISFSLRAAKNTREMLPLLLDEILKAVETDSAAIWLYDHDRNELSQVESTGWLKTLPKQKLRSDEGVVGYVFTSGKVHISNDFSADPLTHPANKGNGWGGITLPIRTTTETIGALVVSMPNTRPIEQHHIQLLSTIAEIAGNAIQRSSLFEQSEKQVQRLTALREIDAAIASSFDLRVTLNILANHILAHINANAVDVLVYNNDNQTLDCIAASGFRSAASMQTSLRISEDIAGRVLLERKDIYAANLLREAGFQRGAMLAHEEFVSYYALPLIGKGLAKGVLEVYFRQETAMNADQLEFLHTLAGQAVIAIDNAHLFENLQRSNQELSLAYDTTLEGWGKALELRDKETQGHTRRVTDLTLRLAREMGVSEADLVHIRRGVLLHDIGKMGIPDRILRKKGELTEKEWDEMKKHPGYAYELLAPIPYLRPALDIPYCHHEWWDGSGYPRGLKGDAIPLAARIFAVVDVWDALLSVRSYRKPWAMRKVVKYIKEQSGSHFDPKVVQAFLNMIEKETEQQ